MRTLLLLVMCVPLAVAARPQEQAAAKDWLSVKEWWGVFEVVETSEGSLRESQGNDFTTNEWKEQQTSYFGFHLDRRGSGAPLFPRGAKPSAADRAAKERWQTWTCGGPSVDFTIDGDSTSKYFSQSNGADTSVICDSRETTKSRAGGGAGRRCDFELQVDIKTGTYAVSAPVDWLIQSRHIQWRGRWSTLHTQEPNKVRIEESGEETGGSVMRGKTKDAGPDGEVDHKGFKIFNQPLPTNPTDLGGSMTFPMELPAGRKGKGQVKQKVVVSWKLTVKPPPPIELELEGEGDGGLPLADWRPRGGTDEQTPGSFVKLKATVVQKGVPLTDPPEYIVIRVTSSSQEKGVCMNWPENPAEHQEPDFRFRKEENGKNCLSDRVVRVLDTKDPFLEAKLACFDYGAWGEVTAVARLKSGRWLTSIVKGKPSERSLRLPERKPGSRIADAWKAVGNDASDDDSVPVGDKQEGDGLTTYEEYRGFMVGGKWTDTDPATKDYFVRNEAGGAAAGGIELFKKLSKLDVHVLAEGEMKDDRVINRNRTEGAHVVDQHAVRVVFLPMHTGFFQAQSMGGEPGLPKDSMQVMITIIEPWVKEADTGGGTTRWMSYGDPSVAHELFHTVNVYHHGEGSEGRTWIREPSGEITENGVKITVVDEAGKNIEDKLVWSYNYYRDPRGSVVKVLRTYKDVVVHEWQGLSSGDTSCVMRYDNAKAYIRPGAPTVRVWLTPGSEVMGGGLCTSPAATGTNVVPGRFGPAANTPPTKWAKDRGNCAGQIVVNDAKTATKR